MRLPRRETVADLRPVWPVLAAVLLFRTGCMVLPFYGAYLISQQHLGPGPAATIVGVFAFGALGADASIAGILRLLSPGAAITLAMCVQCAALAIAALVAEPWALIPATAIWGFCYEVVSPTSFDIVTRTVREQNQRVAFSAVRLCVNVGMGVGPAVGSILYAFAPRLLFVLNAALGLAAALLIALWARGLRNTDRPAAPPFRAWRGKLRDEARIWSFLVAVFPVHVAYGLPTTVVSLYVVGELHLPSYVAGAVFAVNAALIVVFELPLNVAMTRWRNANAIAVGALFAGAGFAAMGLVTSAVLVLAATVIWTIGEMIIAPAFLSYVREISPEGLVTRNLGLFTGDINLGLLVAPSAYVLFRDWSVPGGVWAVVGVFTLGTAAIVKAWARRSVSVADKEGSSV